MVGIWPLHFQLSCWYSTPSPPSISVQNPNFLMSEPPLRPSSPKPVSTVRGVWAGPSEADSGLVLVDEAGTKSGVVAFENVSYDEKSKKSPNSSEMVKASFDDAEALFGRRSISDKSPAEGKSLPAVYDLRIWSKVSEISDAIDACPSTV